MLRAARGLRRGESAQYYRCDQNGGKRDFQLISARSNQIFADASEPSRIKLEIGFSRRLEAMLILSRRVGQVVSIGADVEVVVLSCAGGRVSLGFAAPADVGILRKELRARAFKEGNTPFQQGIAFIEKREA